MIDRRCFVQFIHPGGEHEPDGDGFKAWNRGPHKRKFLRSRGSIVDIAGTVREGELIFWGEWEAESAVAEELEPRIPEGPHVLFDPFYSEPGPAGWRQNTDPFVFGDCFLYTGCMQHTRRGSTQLRHLVRGSVVLFGSCVALSKFVVDTVFVVGGFVDHGASDFDRVVAGYVSDTYRAVTLEPWYSVDHPLDRTYRLYFGVTHDDPIDGMFSFFPASTRERHQFGFARPSVELPGLVTPHLTQGKRLNRDLDFDAVRGAWKEVVRQVYEQGLEIGVRAELPPRRRVAHEYAETPAGSC